MPDGRVRVHSDEPFRRRRLAVLFRVLLVIPHAIVLWAWQTLLTFTVPIGWILALLLGRLPARLHRFSAAYLRYQSQVTAWFNLLSGRYPSFRRPREHPFDVDVPEPQRQSRLAILLRIVLAIPALVLTSVFGVILGALAVGAWFLTLVLGRITSGMQELGMYCMRYQIETLAYVLLLTPRYPKLESPEPPPQQLMLEFD